MKKHILTLIWNMRRGNVWIFCELLLVICALWVMLDTYLVDFHTARRPVGLDLDNTYQIVFGLRSPASPSYKPDSLVTESDSELMMELMRRIERQPGVEAVALAASGMPYGGSNWWTIMKKAGADADDEESSTGVVRCREVTESYFDVFRVRDKEGRPLCTALAGKPGMLVVSPELEEKLYGDGSAVGQALQFVHDVPDEMLICGVSGSIRASLYEASEPSIFLVRRTDEEIIRSVDSHSIYSMQGMLRFKDNAGEQAADDLFRTMGDDLSVGNLYVSCLYPISRMRTEWLKDQEDTHKKKAALIVFVLANIFFGIVGTFWLRTQHRRGELGLRMAIGSSRDGLRRLVMGEGMWLLALTLPCLLFFAANLVALDMLDTHRLALTWWRFALTAGGAYLLMAGMIGLGIWLPVREATRMAPAEALHYE